MSLGKSKCWYSNNCLHFLKRERCSTDTLMSEWVHCYSEPAQRAIMQNQLQVNKGTSSSSFQGFTSVVGRREGTIVMAQFNKHLEPPKIIYICVDLRFICSIYSKYSGVFSNGHFSTHVILDSLLGSISTPLIRFSLPLSPSLPPHSPLRIYLPPVDIKNTDFVRLASLNKLI